MTQVAGADTVLGPFDGSQVEDAGLVHRMVRRGDELWVESRPSKDEDSPPVSRRVAMTTGAHHMQLYWTAGGKGNLLDELPIVFIRDPREGQSRWAPIEASYLSPTPPGVEPHWNKDCILCHATGGQPRLDQRSNTAQTQVAELGIACEACHGPGQEHVRRMADRKAKGASTAPTATDALAIVNPARLPEERAAQVCGHCHALASFVSDELIDTFFTSGTSYRPGDDLLQSRVAILPARLTPEQNEANRQYNPFYDGSYWPDGMVRVVGREYNGLVESACYQNGAMTCLSCHSMHQSDPNDQLAAGKEGNAACYQCHVSYRERLTEHTHHSADSTGSLCFNCHMPHTTYGLLKAVRSHQISSPNVALTLATGRPTACNLCHLGETMAWSTEHLTTWFGHSTPDLNDDQRSLAAGALLLAGGDTVQRALVAFSAGWQPALECGTHAKGLGNDWLAPLLAELLNDESPPVRLIASRSLAALDASNLGDYDFVAPAAERLAAGRKVVERFLSLPPKRRAAGGRRVLLLEDGDIDHLTLDRLVAGRSNTPLRVSE